MRRSEYIKDAYLFGHKVRNARLSEKRILSDIASNVGITESYLSRVENCTQTPRVNIALKIARELGMAEESTLAIFEA